jgi:hypothetical protein
LDLNDGTPTFDWFPLLDRQPYDLAVVLVCTPMLQRIKEAFEAVVDIPASPIRRMDDDVDNQRTDQCRYTLRGK